MASKLKELMPEAELFFEREVKKPVIPHPHPHPQPHLRPHPKVSRSITPDNYNKKPRVNRLPPLEGSRRARDLEEDRRSRVSSSSDVSICMDPAVDAPDGHSVRSHGSAGSNAMPHHRDGMSSSSERRGDDRRRVGRSNGNKAIIEKAGSKNVDRSNKHDNSSNDFPTVHKKNKRNAVHPARSSSKDIEMESITEEKTDVAVRVAVDTDC